MDAYSERSDSMHLIWPFVLFIGIFLVMLGIFLFIMDALLPSNVTPKGGAAILIGPFPLFLTFNELNIWTHSTILVFVISMILIVLVPLILFLLIVLRSY